MRLANGGLELEGLALPLKGGSLRIETLRVGLLSVHVRGVRLKTALPNATKSNGLAQLVRRLAARLVQVSVEGPVEVTITAKDGEITATAAACTIEDHTLRAPAVSLTMEGAEAALLESREALPEPAQAPLVPQGRQGEVTAPSWRGSREPGAPQSWSRRDGASKKRSDAPRRTWDEVERDRNKSYGGMGRRR